MKFVYCLDTCFNMSGSFDASVLAQDKHPQPNKSGRFTRLDMAKHATLYCTELAQRRRGVDQLLYTTRPIGKLDHARDGNGQTQALAAVGDSSDSLPVLKNGASSVSSVGGTFEDYQAFQQAIKGVKLSQLYQQQATVLGGLLQFLHTIDYNYSLFQLSHGVYPRLYQPTNVLWFTTMQQLRVVSPTQPHEFNIPGLNTPGSEFFGQPFRMNQRLYVIIFATVDEQVTFNEQQQDATRFEFWAAKMAERMGGQVYVVANVEDVYRVIDQIFDLTCRPSFMPIKLHQPSTYTTVLPDVQCHALPPCIVTSCVVDGESADQVVTIQSSPIDVYRYEVKNKCKERFDSFWDNNYRHCGFWPWPEYILLHENREFRAWSQPQFRCVVSTTNEEPRWDELVHASLQPQTFSLSKQSPLTRKILEQGGDSCHLCFSKSGIAGIIDHGEKPFAYLKANIQRTGVDMHVLPWDFVTLVRLVDAWVQQKTQIDMEWNVEFCEYLRALPDYYLKPIEYCMRQLNIPRELLQTARANLDTSVIKRLHSFRERIKLAMGKAREECKRVIKIASGQDTEVLLPSPPRLVSVRKLCTGGLDALLRAQLPAEKNVMQFVALQNLLFKDKFDEFRSFNYCTDQVQQSFKTAGFMFDEGVATELEREKVPSGQVPALRFPDEADEIRFNITGCNSPYKLYKDAEIEALRKKSMVADEYRADTPYVNSGGHKRGSVDIDATEAWVDYWEESLAVKKASMSKRQKLV